MDISKRLIQSGDIYETLRLAYCVNQKNLIDAFTKCCGIKTIPYENLAMLANLSNTGEDVKGRLNGNKFSVRDIVHNLPMTENFSSEMLKKYNVNITQ